MKKRLLSFLLCLAILAGQIPAAAFAAEDTPPTEPAAAETILDEQNAEETPAPAAEEEPKAPEAPAAQQPAPTGEAAPEQTPDQQPTQQPETEGSKGTEAAPTQEEQPVPPPENNVADQGEAQPERQPAEGAGPADANSEETEEQPGDSVVTYTITFTDELGTASDETGSEITQAAEGTLVTITAKDRAEEGLLFTAWQAPDGLELADDTEEITTFTMPDSNVELAAEYAPLPEDAEALAEEEEIMLADASPVTGTGIESDPFVVSTYEDWQEKMQQSGEAYIKLGADIDTGTLNSGIGLLDTLTVNGQKQLDLNGHTLRLFTNKAGLGNLIKIQTSSLTLSDSSEAQTGRILGVTSTDSNVLISVWQTGKFTMNSGKLEVEAGDFRGVLWRRTIDCRYGGEAVINGGTLYVPPETYERYENQLFEQFLDEFDDLRNGSCGYTLIADNDCKVTITGGTFQGLVRMNASNSKWNKTTSRVIITGGTFENNVVLNGAGSTAGDGKVTLAEIKGGTFLGKVQAWAAASFDSSFSTPEVVISGGDFHKEFWLRPKFPLVNDKEPEGMAYQVAAKLNGGTFHEGFSADKSSKNYKYSGAAVKQRLEAYEIYQLANNLLGQNAIQTGNGTFAAQDNNSYNKYFTNYRKSEHDSGGYAFIIKAVNNQPTTIIPNAWGIESVTLDGTEINYAKDWKGAVEEMDNSTAHTIKFTWKPLASALVNAGYSYRAECDRYISGSKTPTTDPINATDAEYRFTIDKDAPAKVYSFDLHLNLNKNGSSVGIISNEHIVKLVVNGAPVIEPDPTIEGKVYYTSGIVYGRSISTGTGNLPHGFDSSKLLYQWQRSTNGGSTWTNIEGATTGSYTPTAADMGDTVRIRVKITANGYLGEIVGAPVKVSKAANDNTPAPPAVEAQKDDSNAYTKFKISDFNSNQEYVYTSSPASGSEWPTSGTKITSATVDNLPVGSTYYIYTRYKETDSHTAGSKISSSSVLLDEITKLNRIILTDENGKVYGTYGNGNTIYIKKGTSMTLTATTNPSGANKWSAFTFKSQYNASAPFTVTAPTGPVASGAAIPTVTIHGDTAGTGTLAAEYSGYPAAQSYGTWRVHVYENVSDIGTDAEITVSPSFPDMTMYVGDTMTLPKYTVSVYPEGALDNYNLDWRIIKVGSGGATYPTSNDNITLEDGKIKAEAAHTGGEKTLLGLVAIDMTDSTKIISLSPTSRFYVTVTEAPTVELTGLTVAPAKVNLELNATYQLSAVKEPVNAAGDLTWTSDKSDIAEVDTTGKVTAKAQGTATITVTCGGKSASCTVMVAHTHDYDGQPYLYLDPGSHYQECKANDGAYNTKAHDFSAWTKVDDNTHSRTCSTCHKAGETEKYTETAKHNWQWVVESPATPNAAGKKHEECTDCHAKRSENTVIPMMTSIMVENLAIAKPAKDATAAAATTTDSAYTVASTEWKAANGTTLAVGEKFKPGTVYTASITLQSNSDAVFSAKSTFNAIDGKNAAVAGGALTGDSYAYSIVLTYTFDATEGVAYNITDGANGVWVKGSTGTLSFTADGDLAKFNSVKIDGTELAPDKYTAAAGSTVITLKNEYLSTLAVGAHKIAILFADGDCSTNFTVHEHKYGAWSSDDTHHWHECTDASCTNIADKAEHSFEWKIDVPASQASTGTKHEECTICGKKRNENTVIDKLPGSSSGSGSHHSSSNNNNNNTGTEAAAPEAAAPAPAASAPVTTTTSARTGDSSNLIGWLAVLLISGGAAGAWYTVAKKKKEQ